MITSQLVRKAVIPVAGLGTRLLSATKEQPKEMLPVFAFNDDGQMCMKPVVEMIFGQLMDFGVREFYFIVGRGKRAIQDHFTPDYEFVQRLNRTGKKNQAVLLEKFYKKIEASTIIWVNQPEPRGFGDAIMQARNLVGKDPFLVHAGDTYIISTSQTIFARLTEAHWKNQAAATLSLKEIQDPRQYGVAEVSEKNKEIVDVVRVVEKPTHPASRFALMPVYILNHHIFEVLGDTPPGRGGEIQLTDGIQMLIERGHKVQAIKLLKDDIRLDIGTPETYWEALKITHGAEEARSNRN